MKRLSRAEFIRKRGETNDNNPQKMALTMAVMALLCASMTTAAFAASSETDYGYLTGKSENSSGRRYVLRRERRIAAKMCGFVSKAWGTPLFGRRFKILARELPKRNCPIFGSGILQRKTGPPAEKVQDWAMAIVKEILLGLDAAFGVDSTVGEGSIFWFEVEKYRP